MSDSAITPNKSNLPERLIKVFHSGQLFIDKDGRYLRIREINWEKQKVYLEHYWRNGEWSSYGDVAFERFENDEYLPVIGSIEENEARAFELAANLDEHEEEDEDDETNETSLIPMDGKVSIERNLELIEEKKRIVEYARRVIKRRTDEMKWIVQSMEKKINKLRKVIGAFELYLGIYEEIIQIQEGPVAPLDTPISIRQLVLFMDEEAGDPREKNKQRGIDWQSIDDFDAWLLVGNHLDQVLPEEKGVVALRPSRQKRTYSKNPWVNSIMNDKNNYAYLLIRNGANVYRIWTNTRIGDTLYPTEGDQKAIWANLESTWEHHREEGEDDLFVFKRNALILQGLIDRTEVFNPLSRRIVLMDLETYENNLVHFVRDAEYTLPDGRLPFREWKSEINSKLDAGSRVFVDIGMSGSHRSSDDYSDRFVVYHSKGNYPRLPKSGVYQLTLTDKPEHDTDRVPTGETSKSIDGTEYPIYKLVNTKRRRLRIQYNPKDTVYKNWGYEWNERKNRVAFMINKDDNFIINVDQIDPEDITFYLNNRIERKNYLSIIPLLYGIRDFVISEREKEKDFVRLVAGRLDVDEQQVWDAVSWWKFRNKWKRSIADDDPKALRMIEKRIKAV